MEKINKLFIKRILLILSAIMIIIGTIIILNIILSGINGSFDATKRDAATQNASASYTACVPEP